MFWLYFSYGIVGIILLIIGIIMIVLKNRKMKRCGYESTAVICDAKSYRTTGNSGPRRMYHAVYEYEYNGTPYYKESIVGTSIMPKIGKEVIIYINPSNPNEYYINSFVKNFVYWLLIVLGVVHIISMIVLFLILGM